jgi:hypothetical protein
MLDKAKLLKELAAVEGALFCDYADEYARAREVWQKICADGAFIFKVKAANVPWRMPTWQGELGAQVAVSVQSEPYCVASVDGSQVFPDRHQGTMCSLINVGSVVLSYGLARKGAELSNEPFVYTGTPTSLQSEDTDPTLSAKSGELRRAGAFLTGEELITCQRQEHELAGAVALGKRLADELDSEITKFIFNDGSLIFWHLEAQDHVKRDLFLPRYLEHLQALYELRIPCVGYISLPHSRELVGLLRLATQDVDGVLFAHTLDSTLASFFLEPYERTTVFESHASICAAYPAHLKPYFLYLHVSDEIARLELPAWVAADDMLVDLLVKVVVDQVKKGYGYPVALAEAHEQAVVKGPDREIFYHLITKLGIEQRRRTKVSLKSAKKRSVAV